MAQQELKLKDVQEIIKNVKFMDREFLVTQEGNSFWVQMSYWEADVEKPGSEPIEQKTRKWRISRFMTESEIVETTWAMVGRSQMHVASEHYTYKGRRIYSQHFDVNARIYLCDHNCFDAREPMPEVQVQENPVVPKVSVTEYEDCDSKGDPNVMCPLGTNGCSDNLHYPK